MFEKSFFGERLSDEERFASALRVSGIKNCTFEYPFGPVLPFFTVILEDDDRVEFGTFCVIDKVCIEENYMIATVHNRPYDLNQGTCARVYRFEFNSKEKLISTIDLIKKIKEIY